MLNIPRTKITRTKCAHPLCDQRTNLHSVCLRTRNEILKNERIYIPKAVRVCPQHQGSQSWLETPLDNMEFMYTDHQIEDMVDTLRLESKISRRNAPCNNYKTIQMLIIVIIYLYHIFVFIQC